MNFLEAITTPHAESKKGVKKSWYSCTQNYKRYSQTGTRAIQYTRSCERISKQGLLIKPLMDNPLYLQDRYGFGKR
jgi:hypothetical protein